METVKTPAYVDQIEQNPLNLPNRPAPQLAPHDYWKAKFMREGFLSDRSENNPYRQGSAAAQWWNDGRAESVS